MENKLVQITLLVILSVFGLSNFAFAQETQTSVGYLLLLLEMRMIGFMGHKNFEHPHGVI